MYGFWGSTVSLKFPWIWLEYNCASWDVIESIFRWILWKKKQFRWYIFDFYFFFSFKTFDGKFFSFQGSCKYQLAEDCVNQSFSIRVTNDARGTKSSSWIKTVTLKMPTVRVNLGQKMRVKVNGTRVIPPYKLGTLLDIQRTDEGVSVMTEIGVNLLWDGSNFLQVQAATSYKKKLCGLCGNYS